MSRRNSGILRFLRWPVIVAALVVASPFIWWAWLTGKQEAIRDRATDLYSSLQSGTIDRNLVTDKSAEELLKAEEELGRVEQVTEVKAYLQALGVSGGARVMTVRGGKRFSEHYFTNDETTPFVYLAIWPID